MQFIIENEKIVPAVTTEQMKEIDRIAIEETGPNLFQMMENAGRNLAELSIRVLDKNINQNIIILAGKGGNGGGGVCAARHLANHGYNVKICVTEPELLIDATKYQLHILKSTNAKNISFDELVTEKPDLVIDAIIGYSLSGEPKGDALNLIKWANDQLAIKISLDIPSGIDATTGKKYKYHINPDLTLTLALPKTGLLPDTTGELYLADIGITNSTIKRVIPNFNSFIFTDNYSVKVDYKT
jgi:NAD(P)H-hydrate epimerase